jgi:trk system potassium uptake protein TrkH
MRYINFRSLLKILSLILIIVSFTYLLCIPVALIYNEPLQPFLASFLVTVIPGLLIYFPMRAPLEEKVTTREGYLSVTLSWFLLSCAGTLPYLFSGTIPDFVKALFESVSGYTTTGSTVLTDVEILPRSILFWRSLTHWVGGIGIILLVIIVLPTLKVGGYNLFSLESSVKQKILPKTKSMALIFLEIYLGISVAEVIFLTIGGLGLFESICITFGTVATGGFSIRNTSLADFSPYLQFVVAVFMFMSAASFILYFFLLKREFKRIKQNEELWFYIFFTTASVVFITLILYFRTERDFATSFRHSFFQVIAQITTTGFATTDYMKWPALGWFFMFLLLFAGGSTGSTTGGIKMARHLIALRNMKSVFMRLQHPNLVIPIKLNGKVIPDNINIMMMLFIFVYVIIFLIGTLLIIFTGIPVKEAAGASVTAMSNVGPGLGASGNMGTFGHFNDPALGIMTILMLIGRLELFTFLAIFTRSFWKN